MSFGLSGSNRTSNGSVPPTKSLGAARGEGPQETQESTIQENYRRRPSNGAGPKGEAAIFVAISKVVKINRSTLHTQLRPHLAGLQLLGVTCLQSLADSFNALVFDMVQNGDCAIGEIGRFRFVYREVLAPLTIHAFGDTTTKPDVIWSIATGSMATSVSVRKTVQQHLHEHFPGLQPSFRTCIFQCTHKGNRSLDEEINSSTEGPEGPDETQDVEIEEHGETENHDEHDDHEKTDETETDSDDDGNEYDNGHLRDEG
ncbi:hypothetical protein FPQ18DRAFT_309390 [Pyronema domesticum]|nr:hypothetical protein FPQ18DRAFT_309390 [Pyronema domesticum]